MTRQVFTVDGLIARTAAGLAPAAAPVTSPAAKSPAAAATVPAKLKFVGPDGFVKELRRRVDAYFEQTGRSKRDCPAMYFKTATILTWFFAAYALLVFWAASWATVVPLAIVLGLAVAAIGFNIQHDAGHKAYSSRPWVNKAMSLTMDMVGGSSYLWDWKHNAFHHTYTNIAGHDDDIDVGALARLAPEQPRYKFHRLQCVYLWLLYGFLAIKWHLFDDFWNLYTAKIGDHKIKRPKGKDLAIFIAFKVWFFSLAFGLPLLVGHKAGVVFGTYALAAFVSGVVMSVVFQLAHCVGEADFPVAVPTATGGRIENEWAVHQVQTTVNFARRNAVLRWFLGGLNFQIEHHLFHKICHVHYPALSRVVEETCREFGVRYTAHRTFLGAVASHFRWLVVMGRPIRANA